MPSEAAALRSRVVVLTNGMAPYRVPLFTELDRLAGSLHVIFLTDQEPSREWAVRGTRVPFSHEVLWPNRGAAPYLPRRMWRTLCAVANSRPSALVIGGWGYLENWAALIFARAHRIPVVFWGGVSEGSAQRKSPFVDWLRGVFVRQCDAVVSYSSTAARLLAGYGVATGRIVAGSNVGDVEFFHRGVVDMRAGMPMTAQVTLLYVGQLIERKGLHCLLEAMSSLTVDVPWLVRIVGTGPAEAGLRAMVVKLGLERHVEFHPFVQRNALLSHYAAADIFVLPSLIEPAAIVLSEALAGGLWVLASCRDGGASDLVEPDVNGEIINPVDKAGFAAALRRAITRASRADAHAERANRAVSFMHNEPVTRYAESMIGAVDLACAARQPRR